MTGIIIIAYQHVRMLQAAGDRLKGEVMMARFSSVLTSAVLALAFIAGESGASAQCEPEWQAMGSGMNDIVWSLIVLPNGDLVAGGPFNTAGGTPANHIARWDGSNWFPLGVGFTGSAFSLAVLPNGDLVAGGNFAIARWDGSVWSAFAVGLSGFVRSLAVLPNGDLIAGGYIETAGSVTVNHIARWDGSAWSALGSGMSGPGFLSVNALAVLPGGDLVAAGYFETAGGVLVNNIALWDGSNWSALGGGLFGPEVLSLAVLPAGDLVAGGFFYNTGSGVPVNNIARWDGANWSALGGGFLDPNVLSLVVLPDGDLVAAGDITLSGSGMLNNIARWDGVNWSALGLGLSGSGFPTVHSLAVLPSGDLVAGGIFDTAGGVPANNIAIWSCVPTSCYADCDENTTLNIFDYICYGNAYANNEPYADCDQNGSLNIFDYICFGNAYANGCN